MDSKEAVTTSSILRYSTPAPDPDAGLGEDVGSSKDIDVGSGEDIDVVMGRETGLHELLSSVTLQESKNRS